MADETENVRHYDGDLAMRVIEHLGLNFKLGQVIKYLWRAGRKHPRVLEDLKKAKWYLDREIAEREGHLVPLVEQPRNHERVREIENALAQRHSAFVDAARAE